MLKNIYQKWDELEEKYLKENKKCICSYFISKESNSKLYLCIDNKIKSLYIEFPKKILSNYLITPLKGMDISITDEKLINNNSLFIKLLNNFENEDIFIMFSSVLSDSLMYTKNDFDTIKSFEDTLESFRNYFSNINNSLSKEEEQGLYAELNELLIMFENKGENGILNWQGPSKNKRDFVFDDYSIEVKSTSNQTNTSIKISNENQLDDSYPSSLKKLYLSVYIIEIVDDGDDVISISNRILEKLTSVSNKKQFIYNLLKCKVNLSTYKSKYKFKVQKHSYYIINNCFPKITKHNISNEIHDVTYRVYLSNLDKFIIKENIYE